MPFLKVIILTLCLSSVIYADDLIAGIKYGDSRDVVTKKLSNCKTVKSSIPANLFARVGLNGSFKTTKDLKGLKFTLYFDWTESRGLKEMTYRSDGFSPFNYDRQLKTIWKYAINLIGAIHGRPSNAGQYPKKSEIKPDSIQFSHEWKTSEGYIYLGVGQKANKYSLNITFSKASLST